jgi:DNA repair protein RadD
VIELRDYQTAAVDGTSTHWRAGRRRVLLVSPTGSGKTTIAAEIVRRAVANGRRVLFLAHRRRLIQQIAERCALFGVRYGVVMADLPDERWAVRDAGAPVQIASRDTLLAHVARHGWDCLPAADLLIIDEAHNVESANYARLAEACRVLFWIGLTATPCRADGSGLGKKYWDAIEEAATVADLTAAGHLVPVKAFAPPGIGERRKKGDRTPVAGDPVDHWKRYAEGLRTVVFTRTVAESLAVRDRYRAADVPAEHIDADTPYADRERWIAATEAGTNLVLTNASVLVEGVDIPSLACCQLLCRCGSYVRFAQALGRVLRPFPGKGHAVLLDHAGAVFEHGMPGEPVEWSLSEDDDLDARLKQERKDGTRAEPVCCSRCGCLFAGSPVCPECGTPIPRRKKKEDPDLSRERLVAVNGDPTPQERDRLQRLWTGTVFMARAKGWTAGRAAFVFKKKAGDWPDRLGLSPAFGAAASGRLVADLLVPQEA